MNAALVRLVRASRLATSGDFDTYIECCTALRGGTDPAVLSRMVECLSDAEAGEIQYELIEACETFPDDVFCKVLLACCEQGYRRAPHWFDLMFCSMLNSERLFHCIEDQAPLNPFAAQKISELVANGEVDEIFCVRWLERG